MSGADRRGDPTEPGTEEWASNILNGAGASPTVADGTVYIGSYYNRLYAVDAISGEQEWAFEPGDSIRSSPAVAHGGGEVGLIVGWVRDPGSVSAGRAAPEQNQVDCQTGAGVAVFDYPYRMTYYRRDRYLES